MRSLGPQFDDDELLRCAEERVAAGGGDGWIPDGACAVEEAGRADGCGSCGAAGAGVDNAAEAIRVDHGAGLSHSSGVGIEGMAAAWAGRFRGCGEGIIFEGSWRGADCNRDTKFGEPAPLFPRAEKDVVERMQNLENENNASAVEAASGKENAMPHAPSATSVSPTQAPLGAEQDEELTKSTSAPHPQEASRAVDTAHVHEVPGEVASARVSTSPTAAAAGAPLPSEETKPNPSAAPQQTGPEASAGQAQHITIDDFAKVELRVAQVLVAERIPKADKLLRLEVDLGYEKRQILAGIAQYYEPEKLMGRKIVIVANLAPRKMRGLESNGMLLAASLPPDGAPVLAGFLEDVPLGARLK